MFLNRPDKNISLLYYEDYLNEGSFRFTICGFYEILCVVKMQVRVYTSILNANVYHILYKMSGYKCRLYRTNWCQVKQ